jgi:hypothetical protein
MRIIRIRAPKRRGVPACVVVAHPTEIERVTDAALRPTLAIWCCGRVLPRRPLTRYLGRRRPWVGRFRCGAGRAGRPRRPRRPGRTRVVGSTGQQDEGGENDCRSARRVMLGDAYARGSVADGPLAFVLAQPNRFTLELLCVLLLVPFAVCFHLPLAFICRSRP